MLNMKQFFLASILILGLLPTQGFSFPIASDLTLCEDESLLDFVHQFKKILAADKVWLDFPYEKIRLILARHNKPGTLVFNLQPNELDNLGLNSQVCSEQSLYSLPVVLPPPENGLFDFLIKEGTETYASFDPLLKNRNLVIFFYLNQNYFTPIEIYDESLISLLPGDIIEAVKMGQLIGTFKKMREQATAIHEIFHIYQNLQWAQGYHDETDGNVISRDFSNCMQIPEWKDSFHKLKDISMGLLAEKIPSGPKHLDVIRQLISLRKSKDPKVKACWKRYEFWEKQEGTAWYLDHQTTVHAGLLTEDYHRKVDAFMMNGWQDSGHFYVTGAQICELLQTIYPDYSWQTKIQNGMTPFEVLAEQHRDEL